MIALSEAGQILQIGGKVVAFPTETFFGLAVRPDDDIGVGKLLELKSRMPNEGVPLIASSPAALRQAVVEVPPAAEKLIKRFWPGPLTILFLAKPSIDPRLLGPDNSVAIRVSPHNVASALAAAAGGLITATSANPKGNPPPKSAHEVKQYFPQLAVVDEKCGAANNPSTIIDVRVEPFVILREGAISRSQLEQA